MSISSFFDQSPYAARFEWGEQGLGALGPGAAAIVIVDVLSYSTTIDVACSRGAIVLPYRFKDATAGEFAQKHGAKLAEGRGKGTYSLSPVSMLEIPSGTRVVLPSPNGATLATIAAGFGAAVFMGGLRNAAAVGARAREVVRHAEGRGGKDGAALVIAAGERWPDGSLRPAIEDMIGAGAILSHLAAPLSPEAEVAVHGYRSAAAEMRDILARCASGRQLIEAGYPDDVLMAAEMDVSGTVPVMRDGAFVGERMVY